MGEVAMDKPASGADGPAPFKSTVSATHNDQLGLNPAKAREFNTYSSAKLRGPSATLRKHVKWLKELQKQMAEERTKAEEAEIQAEHKKERMKTFCEKQREAVKTLLNSDQEVKPEHLHEALENAGAGTKTKEG